MYLRYFVRLKTDKKEFFGGIVFIIVWAVMVYAALVIGSLE